MTLSPRVVQGHLDIAMVIYPDWKRLQGRAVVPQGLASGQVELETVKGADQDLSTNNPIRQGAAAMGTKGLCGVELPGARPEHRHQHLPCLEELSLTRRNVVQPSQLVPLDGEEGNGGH
jgi:hypothetical protein